MLNQKFLKEIFVQELARRSHGWAIDEEYLNSLKIYIPPDSIKIGRRRVSDMKPTQKYENKLYKQGYLYIAGLDEAGRGSLAGPLIAGAVILNPKNKIKGIKDSKLLSANQRQKLFLAITKNCLTWSIGVVSPQEIDALGIIPANRLSFERAVKKLPITPQYLLVDGIRNFDSNIKSEFIIKGDQKVLSIAAASIIAKVIRDQILNSLHLSYPDYNFIQHKGYGTRQHVDALNTYGPSEIHRLSFKPIVA